MSAMPRTRASDIRKLERSMTPEQIAKAKQLVAELEAGEVSAPRAALLSPKRAELSSAARPTSTFEPPQLDLPDRGWPQASPREGQGRLPETPGVAAASSLPLYSLRTVCRY